MEVIVIGRMDHTMDNTFESANRVYGISGLCPTIPTCSGGAYNQRYSLKNILVVCIRKLQKFFLEGCYQK